MKKTDATGTAEAELPEELERLRRRVAELEKTEAENLRATAALQKSEQKYRVLLDESSDPIFTFCADGQYGYVNRQFAQGLGKQPEDIIGKKIWDIFPKEDADKRFAAVKSVFESGERKVLEVRVPRPDGDDYYLTTVKPILDDQRRVLAVICISKDITERKIMESQLARMAQVQASADERQRIMQDMHDGFGSQLISSLVMVEHGRTSPLEMAQLLRECIDDLRLTIDALTPGEDTEHTDLLLALGMLRQRVEPRLHPAGIELSWHQTCLGDTLKVAPRTALQVLRTLQEAISNTVKHAAATAIRVTVTEDATGIDIRITDNGRGFDAHAPTSGRGLGNMKKRLYELGGTLALSSSDAGTQLHLHLPRTTPG